MDLSDADKRRLRDAFAVKATLSGNLMTVVGLDDVRARFPELLDRNRDRIVDTARAILKQFTDPATDIVLPFGDGNFVVLFGGLARDEALLRSGMIKAEILRRFVGDEALGDLDIQTRALDIDAGCVAGGSLRDLLAGAVLGDPSRPDPSRPDQPRPEPARRRKQPEGTAANSHKRRMFRASIDHLATDGPVALDALEARFDFRFDDLEFAFQPHLFVKRNVFSVFECRAVRYGLGGDILTGYGVLPRDPTADQVAALDQLTLMRARHGLVDMAVRKRVAVVATPVSFETMTNRGSASDFLTLVQKIPSDLRNYLVMDLCRCPTGVPEGRLAEIIGPLRRVARAVFVRVTSPQQPLASIKAAGAFGVGLALPSRLAGADTGSAAFLERFAGMARKLGLQTYADDVESNVKATLCRVAGFYYLAGRALAEMSDYVGPVGAPRAA